MFNIEDQIFSGYLCPVCGFTMEKTPADFNICPSCGTEFGNDNLDWTFSELRQAWLDNGAQWWSESTHAPNGWNPIEQVLRVIAVSTKGEPIAVNPQHYFSLAPGEWNYWETTGNKSTPFSTPR